MTSGPPSPAAGPHTHLPALQTATPPSVATTPNLTPSPMMSLFRFLHSPSTSAASPSLSSAHTAGGSSSVPASPGGAMTPLSRAVSDPTVLFSPGSMKLQQLHRARSLESDVFRLPDAVSGVSLPGGSSPVASYRSFTVQSGLPVAEAQRKQSNSFLELLCKQDSFMNSD